MKEKDALKKLCPIPFLSYQQVDAMAVFNGERNNCIGSTCMMWQSKPAYETSTPKTKPSGKGWQESQAGDSFRWIREIPAGDCGLKSNCNAYVSIPS